MGKGRVKDRISEHEYHTIATMLGEKLGIEVPTLYQIYKMIYNVNVRDEINHCLQSPYGSNTLWLDRNYIAYQVGYDDVEYVFIHKEIILEDAWVMERDDSDDINRQYREAYRSMEEHGMDYWVRPDYRKYIKEERYATGKRDQRARL